MLYGRQLTRRDVSEHSGSLSQFAGVRLMTLGDGTERGVRMLEFRTGTGLRFTVMVDRGFDIGDCDHKGRAIGWHSPAGFKHPAQVSLEDEHGLGWLRGFSGMLSTCGIDHALGPYEEEATHFNYPYRAKVKHTIHGRIALIPGRIVSYGERWEGDECILFAEGIVDQATVFAENLRLIRRIETRVGSDSFSIHDTVENRGFSATPHMLLYHIDLGHPVLEEGARLIAPIREAVWAAHHEHYRAQGVGYRTVAAPRYPFMEQVWQWETVADANHKVPVAMVNERLGFGVEIEYDRREFPCLLQWQNLVSGNYTTGIEPLTNHVLGKKGARERGELIELMHGETRSYSTQISVLDGAAAIAASEKRIRAIHGQPEDEYPEPTWTYRKLR
jgi:hypothetical protein